jgi:nitrile hydratase accessory protein
MYGRVILSNNASRAFDSSVLTSRSIREPERAFEAPWQASVFALTVSAYDAGLFTWHEWTHCLGARLKSQTPTETDSDDYYTAWLSALEDILAMKQIADRNTQKDRRHAWERAVLATHHGQPIVLQNDPEYRDAP